MLETRTNKMGWVGNREGWVGTAATRGEGLVAIDAKITRVAQRLVLSAEPGEVVKSFAQMRRMQLNGQEITGGRDLPQFRINGLGK